MSQGLRTVVRGAYDIQKLRQMAGNRIVANFKARLGQQPGAKEEEMDKESQNTLKLIRERFKRITDPIKTFPKSSTFKGDQLISDYTELCLVAQYSELLKQEEQHFSRLGHVLKGVPIYDEFLLGVKGVGPAMAGVIVSEIDIFKAKYPSSLWSYAGLDVAPDGQGRSRKKEHLVDQEYIDKEGEIGIKKGITFNPFLKTKLVGVLGGSFLKQGKENKYAKVYYDYKNRLENHSKHKDKTKGHRHNMATRYMIKIFLIDLYVAWRNLEKLPVSATYQEAKLGHVHKLAS
jgi:hypothetical protein